jgi:hypothetical protein
LIYKNSFLRGFRQASNKASKRAFCRRSLDEEPSRRAMRPSAQPFDALTFALTLRLRTAQFLALYRDEEFFPAGIFSRRIPWTNF